jgi:hypothetical protein
MTDRAREKQPLDPNEFQVYSRTKYMKDYPRGYQPPPTQPPHVRNMSRIYPHYRVPTRVPPGAPQPTMEFEDSFPTQHNDTQSCRSVLKCAEILKEFGAMMTPLTVSIIEARDKAGYDCCPTLVQFLNDWRAEAKEQVAAWKREGDQETTTSEGASPGSGSGNGSESDPGTGQGPSASNDHIPRSQPGTNPVVGTPSSHDHGGDVSRGPLSRRHRDKHPRERGLVRVSSEGTESRASSPMSGPPKGSQAAGAKPSIVETSKKGSVPRVEATSRKERGPHAPRPPAGSRSREESHRSTHSPQAAPIPTTGSAAEDQDAPHAAPETAAPRQPGRVLYLMLNCKY